MTRWLDRRIAHPGPFLALCLSEDEYKKAMRHCKAPIIHDWIKTSWSDATAHYLDNDKGQRVSIVCINVDPGRNPIEIAGLLVHEAVHCWQDYCERIGEHRPDGSGCKSGVPQTPCPYKSTTYANLSVQIV